MRRLFPISSSMPRRRVPTSKRLNFWCFSPENNALISSKSQSGNALIFHWNSRLMFFVTILFGVRLCCMHLLWYWCLVPQRLPLCQELCTCSIYTTLDKKKRPLRLCIKSKHCSYHAISAWSGDWHSGTTGRDFAHRCTPKRNQAWFFDIPW